MAREVKGAMRKVLSTLEFLPIGGQSDGVMERKDQTRWAPLLAHRVAAFSGSVVQLIVVQLNANLTKSVGKALMSDCHESMLKMKFDDFNTKDKTRKVDFKVCSKGRLAGQMRIYPTACRMLLIRPRFSGPCLLHIIGHSVKCSG
jgi:hypothetical protein